MRKIFIYLLLLPLFSCDDFLTVESENDVTYVNYFKTESDVEAVIINMMANEIRGWGTKILANISLQDIAALPCDDFYNEKERNLESSVFMNPNRMDSWGGLYSIIGNADMLIDNAYRFEGITQERKEFWLAQANFMKALSYFEIACKWGDAPIPPSSTAKDPIVKSPAKAVLEKAIECAEEALVLPTYDKLVNSKGSELTSKQYASIGTVKTLLANIYAWMGGLYGENAYWEKAEQYASDVIDWKCGFYKLEPDVASLLTKTLGRGRVSDETIFAIEVTEKDFNYARHSLMWYLYPGIALNTYPYFDSRPDQVENIGSMTARISVETVNEMFPEEEDVRRDSFWYNLGKVSYWKITGWDDEGKPVDSVEIVSDYAFFYKWHDVIRTTDVLNEGEIENVEGNRVIWRLADLKLLRAECRARLKMSTAVDDLNDVRKRAGLSEYTGSSDSEVLRREIFAERDRELFGEGQRYFDIVRNGYLDKLSVAYQMLKKEDITRGALYLPVNEKAFNNNELMTQNIYWQWKK